MHTFARHAAAVSALTAFGNFVYLIDEYDTGLFCDFNGLVLDFFLIDQLGRFFFLEHAERDLDGQSTRFLATRIHRREHVL